MMQQDIDLISDIHSGKIDVIAWLSEQNEESIRERVFSRVPDDLDTSVGSYEYDALEPSNLEFGIAYFVLKNIILLAFPQYSYGDWLTLAAESRGVDRHGARYATGILLVSGEKGTPIPRGSKFSTTIPYGSDIIPKYYTTTQDAVIGDSGTAEVMIQADAIGSAGNAKEDEINLNIQSIRNIKRVRNPMALTDGADAESDESLLSRTLERVRNPPSSGNKKDYRRWAREITGVEDAKVIPLWDGPGTVKVIIIGQRSRPIPDLIEEVKEYLDPSDHEGEGEGKAPIGAVVTVTTVELFEVEIAIIGLEILKNFDMALVREDIEANLIRYMEKVEIGAVVRIHDVEECVKTTAGVRDFGTIMLNDIEDSIDPGEYLKPAIKEVIFKDGS